MNKFTLTATASALALFGTAAAQETQSYVQVHGGAFFVLADEVEADFDAFLEDLDLPDEVPDDFDIDASVDYNTGFAIGGLYGYHVSPNFAIEGEVTYRTTDVDGIEVRVELPGEEETVTTPVDGGSLDTIAFMANGVYSFTTDASFVPYVGAGVGYATVDQEDGADLDGAFAYQVKGGVNFPMGQNAFGVEASYFGTTDFEASDDVELSFAYGGVNVMATYKFGF